MSLIVLASDKGSPGVTTTAVALAGVWPRRAVLAECDPSGGDLVYRIPAESGAPLNPNIGMLSLATTARHGLSAHQLEAHLQRMHGGLEVVGGLATGDQSAGLAGLWTALGRAFESLPDADVIADCGRVDATSPALDLMAAAALVVLVARTSAEQIAHVRDRALSLLQRVGGGTATGGGLGVPIGVLLIVDPKQRGRVTAQVDELMRNSGLPVKVIGTIADDPDGADLINGRGRGRLDRTLLIRSTREVALDLSRVYSAQSQGSGIPQQQPPQQPQQYVPGQQAQAQYSPGPPIPGHQVPGHQVPGHQVPGQPIPGQPIPGQPIPGQTAPQPAPTVYTPPPTRPVQPPQTPPPPRPRPGRPTEPTVWPGDTPPSQNPGPADGSAPDRGPYNPFPPGQTPPPAQSSGPAPDSAPGYDRYGPFPPGQTPPGPADTGRSAHEGFTSTTLGGDPDPRSRGEIAPGPGSRRAGPPAGEGR